MLKIEQVLNSFPKKRITLPEAYVTAHNDNYKKNRNKINLDHKLSGFAESWTHRIIAKHHKKKKKILEIGAGNLNHFKYENNFDQYDVVEPWSELLNSSPVVNSINKKFNNLHDVKTYNYYDRIISINTFEHLENLVEDLKIIKKLLTSDGILQVGIPCEGEFAFKLGWYLTTGLLFKIRYGLNYSKIIEYEHVNTFEEILLLLKYTFKNVKVTRSKFLLPIKNFSFYAYIECFE